MGVIMIFSITLKVRVSIGDVLILLGDRSVLKIFGDPVLVIKYFSFKKIKK